MMPAVIDQYALARRRMVEEQLVARGIKDERVISAMEKIPREFFVAAGLKDQAYSDHPLNIGERQTISQPYIVALMTEALQLNGSERVLEIGTGSGYQTAILLELSREVYSIERIKTMSYSARKKLYQLAYDHFQLRVGDGTQGWPEAAPFDAIIVTASGPSVPRTYLEQLADGGRLVIPQGAIENQMLMRYRKQGTQIIQEELGPCRFVKLIGEHGWREED